MSKIKSAKHPSLYTIFNPNSLISAKKPGLTLAEYRAYHEVLNHNHKESPEQLVYTVSYEHVFDINDKANLSHNKKRVADNLQSRQFWFDKDFVEKYFNERKEYSIVPFPKIAFDDDKQQFELELNTNFKKVLTLIEVGFTKGDIQTVRGFKHLVSNIFYWVLRRRQSFKGTWESTFEELKSELEMEGKYKVWKDFKNKVLDVAQEDMKGTWTEFTYKLAYGGRGNAVQAIKLFFTHGPQEENNTRPIGYEFAWEKKLLDAGLRQESIRIFRERVLSSEITLGEQGEVKWDSLYIEASLDAARKQFTASQKQKDKKKKIANMAGWLYEGLEKGWWVGHITKEMEFASRAVQQLLEIK